MILLPVPSSVIIIAFFFFSYIFLIFFFNVTSTPEIYTLSLHDALPICDRHIPGVAWAVVCHRQRVGQVGSGDRKSTRLNSSHANISYAVFCLKKKKKRSRIVTSAQAKRLFTLAYEERSRNKRRVRIDSA